MPLLLHQNTPNIATATAIKIMPAIMPTTTAVEVSFVGWNSEYEWKNVF